YVTAPQIGSAYKVVWEHATSGTVRARVRPSVFFRLLSGGRIQSHVAERSPLRGHLLRLQRLVGGSWRTIAARSLGIQPIATFRPSLPRGVSRLRVLLTAFQAGPGYLPGLSAVHLVRRR
ncbi:MAG TPA: hypothetical protein VMU73_12015, partial [Gaiellaceae bacterium]|nr:hypothetical protein [Gaiellaceae bacterium]